MMLTITAGAMRLLAGSAWFSRTAEPFSLPSNDLFFLFLCKIQIKFDKWFTFNLNPMWVQSKSYGFILSWKCWNISFYWYMDTQNRQNVIIWYLMWTEHNFQRLFFKSTCIILSYYLHSNSEEMSKATVI